MAFALEQPPCKHKIRILTPSIGDASGSESCNARMVSATGRLKLLELQTLAMELKLPLLQVLGMLNTSLTSLPVLAERLWLLQELVVLGDLSTATPSTGLISNLSSKSSKSNMVPATQTRA